MIGLSDFTFYGYTLSKRKPFVLQFQKQCERLVERPLKDDFKSGILYI